ncbi:excinuclease ABC subunit UvrA [Armatimonas rosea]|uniref:UvrABC system protein A n=1 Tax=Armatimonas rosea TaxID=685828 RepID=A0A7W9SMI3_ARMRO|nr:excinuclease ABC subunit UvrA [Armatimonas rosea]MBB6048554.1 excinuclease ABC subunit A [Armatimonas rosea]
MRETILIRGARENNLKNVTVEIPRDKLIVLTGLSGSGKSSLAFDTLYAEAQRRFMESLSAWTRRFVQQQSRPKVDAILGLSPVISIEQKTITKNPRSTVGTMTDVGDYLRLLYATSGEAHCLRCDAPIPTVSLNQLAEHLLALPEGTAVELCAPVAKVYGEEWSYLFTELRTKGCRRVRVNGELRDLADELALEEEDLSVSDLSPSPSPGRSFFAGKGEPDSDSPFPSEVRTPGGGGRGERLRAYQVEAVVDRVLVKRSQAKQLLVALTDAAKLGEGFVRCRFDDEKTEARFYVGFGCPEHRLTFVEREGWYFSFNEPESACLTCSGLGTYLRVHTGLLVPDPSRSILGGAFVKEAFNVDKNTNNGRIIWGLAAHYGFSLETPFAELPEAIKDILFWGTKGEEITLVLPPGGRDDRSVGRKQKFAGVATQIDRWYRWYRQKQESNANTEDWLRKVMVETTCPDCQGVRLRRSRTRIRFGGTDIHTLSNLTLADAAAFLRALPSPARSPEAARQILQAILSQLELLCDIGLDYLSLSRRSGTLSGGESQRIRLSAQIASELMGMLYVLDEPSIGLHPKDNEKLIATLRRLRDIGNTVIVVEHDTDTIRAADHILEIGPGPGIHGGEVVASGTVAELCASPDSLTGAFLSGRREIALPKVRRAIGDDALVLTGARENNLKNLTVRFPLGVFIAVTGASGSGKSTLVNDILHKQLYNKKYDSRVLAGAHDSLEGIEKIGDVIEIDQSPIGRSPRSNPATYVGFYDDIRQLFASVPLSVERGYSASRFSFNVKGGRCEECGGEGTITTKLNFMPDVEAPCHACKGSRYNAETLEVLYNGKSIADVLAMSIEDGAAFFTEHKKIAHKLRVLADLGLGYLTLGHPAPILSGGEAQRVKLATELAKIKRGAKNLYILDEPTTGLHLADIQRLLDCLNRLVDAGNTVLVIEHHLDIIKCADWVLDLGPDGGKNGGTMVVEGTPETVAACPESHTGRFLKALLPPSLSS